MTSKILLSGGCVLTLGAKTPNFTRADVLIDDETPVAKNGTGLRARDAEHVDATVTPVMPALCSIPTVMPGGRFPGTSALVCPPGAAKVEGTVGAVDAFRPDDVYAATSLARRCPIEAGITTVVDWSSIRSDDALEDAALQAHVDSGLRTVFVHARAQRDG